MLDLVYFGYKDDSWEQKKKFKDEIESAFPDVELENADEQTKGARWELHLPDEKEDEYFRWLMVEGWHGASLSWGTAVIDEDQKPRMERLLADVREELETTHLLKKEDHDR